MTTDEDRLTAALGSVASAVLHDRCPTGMEVVAWRAWPVSGGIIHDQSVLDYFLGVVRKDAEVAWRKERAFKPTTQMLDPYVVDEAAWNEVHDRLVARVDGAPVAEPGWRLGSIAVIVMGRIEQSP